MSNYCLTDFSLIVDLESAVDVVLGAVGEHDEVVAVRRKKNLEK